MNKLLTYYKKQLGIDEMPEFLVKYLETEVLTRLKGISYLCGMDYASKHIYNFAEEITRFDHALTSSLMTWKLTHDKLLTLATLYHDGDNPCFSHVIDYMNKDYNKQETTEKNLEEIIYSDKNLLNLFKEDKVDVEDIINFKKFTIVDNKRPKACIDRIDGVILTGISWTENINEQDIKSIVSSLEVYENEEKELEIGFNNYEVARIIVEVSNSIDLACHSKEDYYMMELLAQITRLAIKNGYIKYEDLYKLTEKELFNILKKSSNVEMITLLHIFENIRKEDIPSIILPDVKVRNLIPLVNSKRLALHLEKC